MTWLKTAVNEIWGLFVDDELLAVLAIIWLVLARLAVHHASGLGAMTWTARLFFAGLAAILVISVVRAAKRAGDRGHAQ